MEEAGEGEAVGQGADEAEGMVAKSGARHWSTRRPMEARSASADGVGDVGKVAASVEEGAGGGLVGVATTMVLGICAEVVVVAEAA